MKKIFIFVFVSFLCLNIFAATVDKNQSIQAYRNALISFDNQDYGTALKYSEDAIMYRKQFIEKQIETLKISLSAKKVHSAGDSIIEILRVLKDRGENNTINIINSYLKIKGEKFFENSIQKLLDYMNESIVYPEAQKLIGDVYKLEGEYDFAEEYYQLALSNAAVLDIPNEKYDILYELAEISRLENDTPKMEERLLNILIDDKNYMDSALNNSMVHTIKQNKKDSMEKFFNLYRSDSYLSIDAYNQLAEYYYNAGEKEKALQFAALSSITSFSKINEIISSRNSEYSYKNLSIFFQEAGFYDDIVQWGNDTKAWSSFNILARYTKEMGYTKFSHSLLMVLAQFSPEKYWQRDAVLLLEDMQ